MNRRYICIPTVGSLDQNLARIRSHIYEEGLAHRYPVVRYERPQQGRRGGGGQLYLFLGVDLDPKESTKLAGAKDREFLNHRHLRSLSPELLALEQIRAMTGSNEITTEGFWFRYKPAELAPPPPTFQESDDFARSTSVSSEVDSSFEHLLWWLSARAQGSWADLTTAVHALNLGSSGLTPAGVARNLILLGHVEQDPATVRWSIAPPCRVEPVLDEVGPFHAGARGPGLMSLAQAHEGIEASIQPAATGPARVGLRPDVHDRIQSLPTVGVVAERLAERLPPLSGWIAGLLQLDRPCLGGGKLERFDGRDWQAEPRMHEGDTDYCGPSGLYRFVGEGERVHWCALFLEQHQRWYRADLSGLKFAALALETPDLLKAVLDRETQDLLIPASQRWPLLFERALVLASGWLPCHADAYLRYRAIGRPLAERLATWLGIALVNGD